MSPRGSRRRGAGYRDPRVSGLGVRDPSKLRVHGVSVVDDIRDKLVALMNQLKVAMAEGYDPTFANVYDHHRVAKLEINAVSVDVEEHGVDENIGGGVGKITVPYDVQATIRVHVAQRNGFLDSRDVTALLQSIDNYLHENIDLGDDFWINSTGPTQHRVDFSESETLGGELTVNIKKYQEYTQ